MRLYFVQNFYESNVNSKMNFKKLYKDIIIWLNMKEWTRNKEYFIRPNWFADTVFNVSQQWATNILDELFPEVVQIPSTINVISTMTTGLWQNKKKVSKPCYYRDTVQLRPQTVQ